MLKRNYFVDYAVDSVSTSRRDVVKLVAVSLRAAGSNGLSFPVTLDIELPMEDQPLIGNKIRLLLVDESVDDLADDQCPHCHRRPSVSTRSES